MPMAAITRAAPLGPRRMSWMVLASRDLLARHHMIIPNTPPTHPRSQVIKQAFPGAEGPIFKTGCWHLAQSTHLDSSYQKHPGFGSIRALWAEICPQECVHPMRL